MAIEPQQGNKWYRSRTMLALLAFLAIAGFFLLTEHTALVFGALPILLVLACPLMHLFMHGRRRSGGTQGPSSRQEALEPEGRAP